MTVSITSQGPFVFTVLGTINSAGEVVADLSTVAAGSLAIANNLSELTATGDTALANLNGTAVGIDIFKATDAADARSILGSSVVGDAVFVAASAAAARATLLVNIPPLTCNVAVGVTTASAVYLRVPTNFSGTVTSIVGVTNGDPGGNVAFTSAIGTSGGAYNPITAGDFTVTNGATAGTAFAATPVAANAVVGGTSIIQIAWDNGAASAIGVGLTIEITRT